MSDNTHRLQLLGQRFYSDTFSKVVVCCLALIVMLSLLVLVRGPHIREVTFNPELPTQFSGEWLVLHVNQPLRPVHASQVTLTPETPFSILSSGSEVAVQLQRRLPYDTRYSVKVDSPPVKLSYDFMTPQGVCYYLISPGTIKKHIIFGSQDQTVYQSSFINTFALTGNNLAVVDQTGITDTLVIINTVTGKTFKANLPQDGTIQRLRASPDGNNFSFTFTSLKTSAKPYYNSTLYSFSVDTDKSTPVYGFNHKTIRATDWTYSPDGSVMVVQTFSSVIEAVYLDNSGPPLPIGSYGILSGFSYNGGDIYAGTLEKGTQEINVTSRATTTISMYPLGQNSTLLSVYPLLNSNGYIELVQVAIPNSANFGQYVILVQSKQRRVLYASKDGSVAISGISVSPNDEYISIGVTPTVFRQQSNGTPASTQIVMVSSGRVVDTIPSLEQVIWQ